MKKKSILIYTPNRPVSESREKEIIDFLYEHLDQYGDPKKDIKACIDFAMGRNEKIGGFILVIENEKEKPIAALVMNKTGMKGYIPENILVYIATNAEYRGNGLGKQLLNKAFKLCEDEAVALHCDMDNPARNLYEREGFEVKYFEMRKQ